VLSIIIPTLNAAETLPATLAPLIDGALRGFVKEVIVVDGGSQDATCAIAEETGATIVESARGRGVQLRAGADAARAPALLFLHADTILSPGWIEESAAFLARPDARRRAAAFAFAFDDQSASARFVAAWVDLRCLLFALPYGDQGLLLSRALYDEIGGYRPLPLMEDVDMIRRLGRARLHRLRTRAVTSAARYRREGFARRGVRNLSLIARYYMGADPAVLARDYD
jgi:rSAM/selenodomain-associated transferase 2